MKKPIPLVTPPAFQQYDCQMCGACCSAGFAVVVTAEERARIEAQGWEKNPDFPHRGKQLFIRQIGGETILALQENGSCIFLDEHNACRIHAQFGAEGKPFACRPYPFMFLATGSQVRVNLRFDCPSVVGNQGRPLPAHRTDLVSLIGRAVPEGAAHLSPPPFRPGVALSWHDLLQVAEAFDRVMAAETLDITRRVLACADMLGVLRATKMDGLQGRKLVEFLELLTGNRLRTLEKEPLQRRRPRGMVPLLFRQAAGLYGRLDRVVDTQMPLARKCLRLGRRLSHSLRLLGGVGTVPRVRADLPRLGFRQLEVPLGVPGDAAAAVLTRYYRVKLTSLGFCGRAFYGWPFLEGLGALLLTYPLILWYARLFALGAGKEALDAESMQRAVRVVDRPRGVSVPLSLRSERIRMGHLSEHENLSRLILWYGL